MSTLEIIYLVLGLVGAIFLGLSIFGMDGDVEVDIGEADFDISDAEVGVDSPSLISFRTIATFFLVFGISGFLGNHLGYSTMVQLIVSLSSGLGVGVLYGLVMKGMFAMQGDSSVSEKTLVGKTAIVTTPSVTSGICQVKFTSSALNEEYTAREINNVMLKQNQPVTVISSSGGMLMVEKQ